MSRTCIPLVLTAVMVGLTGCGAANTTVAQERSAIGHLREALLTYNASSVSDLSEQAGSCRQAAASLSEERPLSASRLPTKRAEAVALSHAFELALSGFKACARAASALDYPEMMTAMSELAKASSWIARARRLEVANASG